MNSARYSSQSSSNWAQKNDLEPLIKDALYQINVKHRNVLQNGDNRLNKIKRVVVAAMNQNIEWFYYADSSFKEDPSFIASHVKYHPELTNYMDPSLEDNENIQARKTEGIVFRKQQTTQLLSEIKTNAAALKNAPLFFMKDKSACLLAITQNPKAFYYLHPSLKNNLEFNKQAIRTNSKVYRYLSPKMQGNDQVKYAFEKNDCDWQKDTKRKEVQRKHLISQVLKKKIPCKDIPQWAKRDIDFFVGLIEAWSNSYVDWLHQKTKELGERPKINFEKLEAYIDNKFLIYADLSVKMSSRIVDAKRKIKRLLICKSYRQRGT